MNDWMFRMRLHISAMAGLVAVVTLNTGCGGHVPQITNAQGFYMGEPTDKFVSAIFDTKEYGAGRKATFLFVGQDADLCQKVVGEPSAVDGQSDVHGPIVAGAWTGVPERIADSYQSGRENRHALKSGKPNRYRFNVVFRVSADRGVAEDAWNLESSTYVSVHDVKDKALYGMVWFGGQRSDQGRLDYEAQRCPGLADTALRWFTNT